MIKVNVINNNISWFRFIKDPSRYIDKKIKKLNYKNKKLKKNRIFCSLDTDLTADTIVGKS